MRATIPPSGERQRLIRLVHIAKRDLNLDTDTYRAALLAATGKDSCAAMGAAELQKALDHMKRFGFKVRAAKAGRSLDQTPVGRKVRALWLLLHELGAVADPSEAALGAYARRIAGVDALQWTDGQQMHTLIETLKRWALRVLPDQVTQALGNLELDKLDEHVRAALQASVARAFSRGTFDPMLSAWEQCKDARASINTKE